MDNQFDSESYWNRSTSKAFSFDDDEAANSVSSLSSVDGVVPSARWLDADTPSGAGGGGAILNEDTISEASFDNSVAGGALNLSIKSVISDEALKVILEEQTLDDRIISKGVQPEEELKLLRRQIQTTLYAPLPEATAHKLLLGKSVPLEVFKSLYEKQQLLDAVLRCGGGDAIIHVLLFLKRTLKWAHFHALLQPRPRALQQYVSYLKQRYASSDNDDDSREVEQLLKLLGQQQEAALLQFLAVFDCNKLPERKQKLRQLLEQNAALLPTFNRQLCEASLKLLELVERERNALDNRVALDSTPVEVLHACCRKHSNWKEPELQRSISPFRCCSEQLISPAQFEWTALNERATAQAYADLESVFERVPSAWHPLPLKQRQFHISFSLEAAVLRLHELQAPPTVLYLFLSKMSNTEEKLALAQRVKSTKGVIDALLGLKELTQLQQLRDTLPERSEEQFYCDKALKTLQSKRWSTDNINIKLKL